jgi:hypothetical protein
MKPRFLIGYFCLTASLFILGIVILPNGKWNYAPIVYALIGPAILGMLHLHYKTKLEEHMSARHSELFAKNAVSFGVRKGESLDVFQLNIVPS